MYALYVTNPEKPKLSAAFKRAREIISSCEIKSLEQIFSVYRQCRIGGWVITGTTVVTNSVL